MIRPASEIQYPPSEALCTKARMIARMESLASSTDDLMAVIAKRIGAEERRYLAEIEMLTAEQQRLVENMKRIVRG
ncbi:MAG: hypothetical protein AAGA76_13840 [Pseudomonadota bacterium]